jgi:hypothetical protein
MKTITLFTFFACVLSFSANAQIVKKSDKLLGGSLYTSASNNNPNGPAVSVSSNAGVLPSFAVAVKDNLTFGTRLQLNYYNVHDKNGANESKSSSFSTGLQVFLRKYKPLKDRFGISFDNSVSGSASFSKSENNTFVNRTKSYSAGYAFTPGVFYKFSEKFLGEASIGGAYAYYNPFNSGSSFSVGLNFLTYFNLGFNYIIGKN